MDERFDVVVIGAGPAGCCAAREAALRGAGSVLLLEREEWPRDKVCAGGLSPPARRVLRRMGLWSRVLPLGYPIRAARLRTPGGRELLVSGRRTSLVVRRRLLDALLAEEAVRAGAVLRTGCRAQALLLEQGRVRGVKAGGASIGARRVILAPGAGSRYGLRPPPSSRWLAWPGPLRGGAVRAAHHRAVLRSGALPPLWLALPGVGVAGERRFLPGARAAARAAP